MSSPEHHSEPARSGSDLIIGYAGSAFWRNQKRFGRFPGSPDGDDLAHDVYVEVCKLYGPEQIEACLVRGAPRYLEMKRELVKATRRVIQRHRFPHRIGRTDAGAGDPTGEAPARRRIYVADRNLGDSGAATLAGDGPGIPDTVALAVDLQAALGTLDEPDRIDLIRHAVGEEPYAAIAGDDSPAAVKRVERKLNKIKDRLRAILNAHDPEHKD